MDKTTTFLTNRYPHISFQNNWSISSAVYFKLGECRAIVQSLIYLPLAPTVRKAMLNVSLIKGAQATTAIEGNTLSEDEINEINNGASLPESRKYLETEVKNVISALNKIFDEVVNGNNAAYVTPELICNFNRQVGENLGDAFKAIPGRFRENDVTVGNVYRAPDYKFVRDIMVKFCNWLRDEFKFKCDEEPDFITGVIESIVAHVYIAWIHPFGDGNGRTARLLEFYLLLRSGMPNICSHILSNHYNQTRSEYYRQLDQAGKKQNLSDFIEYAVQGLLDGLNDVLWQAQRHQLDNAWKNYVYEIIDNEKKLIKTKKKRMCRLLLQLDITKEYSSKTITETSVDLGIEYSKLSQRSIDRDIDFLIKRQLLLKKGHTYSANVKCLVDGLPRMRNISRAQEQLTQSAN